MRAEREETAVNRINLERVVASVHLDLTIDNRDGSLLALVDVADAGRVVFRHGETVVDTCFDDPDACFIVLVQFVHEVMLFHVVVVDANPVGMRHAIVECCVIAVENRCRERAGYDGVHYCWRTINQSACLIAVCDLDYASVVGLSRTSDDAADGAVGRALFVEGANFAGVVAIFDACGANYLPDDAAGVRAVLCNCGAVAATLDFCAVLRVGADDSSGDAEIAREGGVVGAIYDFTRCAGDESAHNAAAVKSVAVDYIIFTCMAIDDLCAVHTYTYDATDDVVAFDFATCDSEVLDRSAFNYAEETEHSVFVIAEIEVADAVVVAIESTHKRANSCRVVSGAIKAVANGAQVFYALEVNVVLHTEEFAGESVFVLFHSLGEGFQVVDSLHEIRVGLRAFAATESRRLGTLTQLPDCSCFLSL